MSNKIGDLHIVIGDNGYHLSTSSCEASYTLNGIPTLKLGIVDNLPDRLHITDNRSLPSAADVSATPTLWGAQVKWGWPKEADSTWQAKIRAEWCDGDEATTQGQSIRFPQSKYVVTGVPAGREINVTITLTDGSSRRSRPVEVATKSSDDASEIIADCWVGTPTPFIVKAGQVFINKALVDSAASYSVQAGVKAEDVDHASQIRELVEEVIERALQPGGKLYKR